jgi:hypothetical protein
LRRVAWLGDQNEDFARGLLEALDRPDLKGGDATEVDLVQEADNHLLMANEITGVSDPRLLAVYDLLHMRSSGSAPADKTIDRGALEAQRPFFVHALALFDYLMAAHAFYDEGDPGSALARLTAKPPKGRLSYLEFSRQVLRAMALGQAGDHAGARALWLALMPQARPPFQHAALELGLAMNEERGGALQDVFAAESPITDPDIREILLRNDAGAALLRQQVRSTSAPEHERRTALYALLYKEVTRGRYGAFVSDLAFVPPPPARAFDDARPPPDPDFTPFRWDGHALDGYACTPLRDFAAVLARNPKDPQSLVCLNEFIRIGDLDDDALDKPPAKDELGGAPSQFPGGPFSRLGSYKALLADPKTPDGVRAYVLYRAVECYAPSGYDHCGRQDVPPTQRKAWFQSLKARYPKSVWAQRLKYYW